VALPLWHHSAAWNLRTWAGVLVVTSLVFARTAIHNIKDMQNDQILGRETLPILIGRRATKIVLLTLLTLALAAFAWTTLEAGLPRPWLPIGLATLAAAYPVAYLWLYHERFTAGSSKVEPPLELSFYLVGLLALL